MHVTYLRIVSLSCRLSPLGYLSLTPHSCGGHDAAIRSSSRFLQRKYSKHTLLFSKKNLKKESKKKSITTKCVSGTHVVAASGAAVQLEVRHPDVDVTV